MIRAQSKYDLDAALIALPPDVSRALFLQLVDHCRPGLTEITFLELQKFIAVARSVQQLSPSSQLLLPSKRANRLNEDERGPDPQEQEAWIKEKVDESLSWVTDLRRLRLASASHLWAARRSWTAEIPKDWANQVLEFHYCQPLPVQDSLAEYMEKLEDAFLQLPDRRWYIKYRGEAVPPLADKLGGLSCIHSLIRDNHLRNVLVRGNDPQVVFTHSSSALGPKERERNSRTLDFAELKSLGNAVVNGKSTPEYKQISRAIQKIASHNSSRCTEFRDLCRSKRSAVVQTTEQGQLDH